MMLSEGVIGRKQGRKTLVKQADFQAHFTEKTDVV